MNLGLMIAFLLLQRRLTVVFLWFLTYIQFFGMQKNWRCHFGCFRSIMLWVHPGWVRLARGIRLVATKPEVRSSSTSRRWQALEHAMWQWPDLECGKSNAIYQYYHLGFLCIYIYVYDNIFILGIPLFGILVGLSSWTFMNYGFNWWPLKPGCWKTLKTEGGRILQGIHWIHDFGSVTTTISVCKPVPLCTSFIELVASGCMLQGDWFQGVERCVEKAWISSSHHDQFISSSPSL